MATLLTHDTFSSETQYPENVNLSHKRVFSPDTHFLKTWTTVLTHNTQYSYECTHFPISHARDIALVRQTTPTTHRCTKLTEMNCSSGTTFSPKLDLLLGGNHSCTAAPPPPPRLPSSLTAVVFFQRKHIPTHAFLAGRTEVDHVYLPPASIIPKRCVPVHIPPTILYLPSTYCYPLDSQKYSPETRPFLDAHFP